MSENADANRTVVLQMMDAMNAGDGDRIRELLHPDATWWVLRVGIWGVMGRDEDGRQVLVLTMASQQQLPPFLCSSAQSQECLVLSP